MFKIESYVTPILLSYVDKYVRDFKPADAQVSLWGGGVVLHNLVLKADVLQQEVSLPFTLVSGRIHELLIQVPWTKIMSEPIIVTIDTIECVLSLNPPVSTDETAPPESPSRKTQLVEAPPGYMQALVRRIVSNIALRIHHLIVKYVQDDIVMSLNVKHLAVDSAGANWEPTFADIDQNLPLIRRLVRLDDFTLCLDRADSDGKIRFYQEPLLYRCQLDLRVLTRLVSANTRRASSLSVQLRSTRLAWGVTSDQLTLLLRLTRERNPEETKAPPPAPKTVNVTQAPPIHTSSSNSAEPARSESWSEWAWSWMPAWIDREGGVEEALLPPTPTPVNFTAYFDDVSFVFKVMEFEGNTRKRARVVLELTASHAAVKSAICSPTTMNLKFGTRDLKLCSHGKCVCGYLDYCGINGEPTVYMRKIANELSENEWTWPEGELNDYKVETAEVAQEGVKMSEDNSPEHKTSENEQLDPGLPEEPSTEPQEIREESDELWHVMEPLIYLEYNHDRAPPDDYINPYDNPPKDYEYSDWSEECNLKVQIQPMEIRICMGLVHRLSALKSIYQELPPVPEPELPMRILTVEECDALSDNLPQRRVSVEAKGLRIRTLPWEHSPNERANRPPVVLDVELPKSLIIVNGPLYPHRVCSAACQMPDDAGPLWQGARLHISASFHSIQVRICSPCDEQPRPCARADVRFVTHLLLNKEYFNKRESVVFSYSIKIREANVCGSSARLQAAWQIPLSLLTGKPSLLLKYTMLAKDALTDEEAVAVDVTIEDLSVRGYMTRHINTHIISLQTAKATTLQETRGVDLKQAWLFAGPDTPTTTPYLRAAIQWCSEPVPISLDYVGIWMEQTAFCVDPLFIAWLAYKPAVKPYESQLTLGVQKGVSSTQYFTRRRPTPPSSSGRGATRTGSGADMVHSRTRSAGSSSEPSERKDKQPQQQTKPVEDWWTNERLLAFHERLKRMLVNIEVGLVLAYVTLTTATALDSATVRDAMERHAINSQRVLSLSFGRLSMHSSSNTKHLWHDIRHDGPTFVEPKTDPNQPETDSFPWKMRIADMSCYTLEVRASRSFGRETSGGGLHSQLKIPCSVTPRTILDLVSTSVTLSVVTKAVQFKAPMHKETKKHTESTVDEDKLKYFKTGMDFKPSTLKEFVRGPARRNKAEPEKTEVKPEPAPVMMTSGPVVSLGVHLHADTPPLILRLDHEQVHIVSATLHCFNHILTLLQRQPLVLPKGYTTLGGSHRSLIRSVSEIEEIQSQSEDTQSENRSDLVPIFQSHSAAEIPHKLKTFFWFQWVVSRTTVFVTTPEAKLAFDIDDIISTVDLQSHYNQLKIKVASASVRHYERVGIDEWAAGVLSGRVLEAREPTDAKEENHFLAITITQAQISNLPASWKEELHPKLLEQKNIVDSMWEIYATLAPLEMVLQPTVLEHIMTLMREFVPRSFCPLQAEANEGISTWQWPFLYVTAGGLRLLMTCEDEDQVADDTFMFVIGKVTVNPHPENPICRRAINTGPDSGWLVAGGGYEGRQYEILVKNVGIRSAQFKQLVNQETSEVEMLKGTGGENPALKWTQPVVSPVITPILHSVDIGCVLAPALYLGGALASGPAVELNLLSDCAIELSIEHLDLLRRLMGDITEAVKNSNSSVMAFSEESHGVCPYATVLMAKHGHDADQALDPLNETPVIEETSNYEGIDIGKSLGADSGIETSSFFKSSRFVESSSIGIKKSVSIALGEQMAEASEYLEVYVTMGMIELSLYTVDDNSPEVIALRPPKTELSPTPEKYVQQPTERDKETVPPRDEDMTDSLRGSRSKSLSDNIRIADMAKSKLEFCTIFAHARKNDGNLPLVHVSLQQPNLYYWRKKSQKSLQVSLFNAWMGLGVGVIEGNWHAALLTTAKGSPDPVTEIPPALATMKIVGPSGTGYYQSNSSTATKGTIRLDIERPVLIEVCTDRIRRIKNIIELIKSKLAEDDEDIYAEAPELPFFYRLKRIMAHQGLESITVQTSQIGVCGSEGTVGWDGASVQVTLANRPDRLSARGAIIALLVAAGPPGDRRHVLLHPLMLGMGLEATWEAWRRAEGGLQAREPTVRVGLEVDRVIFDLRPTDLATLNRIKKAIDIIARKENSPPPAPTNSTDTIYCTRSNHPTRLTNVSNGRKSSSASLDTQDANDHYYKDDLRSGAFKIISGGQLPMAYQVMLHGSSVSWRYPHPRAITRLVAFPMPGLDQEVECVLELYSPMLGNWEQHTYFNLPVREPKELHLYAAPPDAVFAQMWRFRARGTNEAQDTPYEFDITRFMPKSEPTITDQPETTGARYVCGVTAEQLSGVLRVDSYFTPRQLPLTRVVLRVAALEIHAHNSIPFLSSQVTALEGYYVSRPLMRSHRVLSIIARDITGHAQLGSSAGCLLLADGNLSADIMDCATGTMEQLVDEFRFQSGVAVTNRSLCENPRTRVAASKVHVALHVPRLRTLHSLATDWISALDEYIKSSVSTSTFEVPEKVQTKREVAAATAAALEGRVSLWIHNSCAAALRVGQEQTDEVVPLGPGARLAYRWRSPNAAKRLRFALAGPTTDWHWSTSIPFAAGTNRVRLEDAETLGSGKQSPGAGVFLYTKVEEDGARRSLHLAGRLALASMLRFNLLYKVRARCSESNLWRTVCSGELASETVGRSVVCGTDCEMVLKIKFTTHDTGWSGDIPLKECPKENVPWLVKVPSEGDVPYMSVWCRVVRGRTDGRILATVWPLYVLHSHLPLDIDVLIATNTGVSSPELGTEQINPPPRIQTAPGRGTSTHLLAPGTTAARHSLSFQYRNIECPVTREAVLLHYGVTDTSVFDKRTPIASIEQVIDDILLWLAQSGRNAVSAWPYSIVSKHWGGQWQPALLQPRCDVTVRYRAVRAGGGCSLEVQLCPTVLLCNAAPIALTLRANDAAPLCKLEPGSAISPPSIVLKKPFFMSVEMGRETFVSGQLQLCAEEPGRYGEPPPRQVALDRSADFAIQCNHKVALLTMYYEIKESINVLGVSSTYVLINRLDTDILVSAVAMPSDIEEELFLRSKSFKVVTPTKEGSIQGVSLCKFWLRGRWRGGDPSELSMFLSVALPAGTYPATQPVPVRLGAVPTRRAIALADVNKLSVPVVVTQIKHEGRLMVVVAKDPCPQFVVHNRTKGPLAVAQPVHTGDDPSSSKVAAVLECSGTNWWCIVQPQTMTHYSTPAHCARYPPQTATSSKPFLPFLIFAKAAVGKTEAYVKRCVATKLQSAEKLMYVCKNQLGIEKEYEQRLMPDGKLSVDGFLCIYDVSLVPGRTWEKQNEILAAILQNILKLKKPVVLVTAKNDEACEQGVREAERLVQRKEFKGSIPIVETSSHDNVNVDQAFFLLAQMVDKAKARIKVANYAEALRVRRETLDFVTEAFTQLIRIHVKDHKEMWSAASKRLCHYPEWVKFVQQFGNDGTQVVFRRHIRRLKEERSAKKLRKQLAKLPQVLSRLQLPTADLQENDWPVVVRQLRSHRDFSVYFSEAGALGSGSESGSEAESPLALDTTLRVGERARYQTLGQSQKIPYEILESNEAAAVFKSYLHEAQEEQRNYEWCQQFKRLLEETGYVTPGKQLSEVRVLLMGRECYEALSEEQQQRVYDQHQRQIQRRAKHNLQELLLEHADLFYHFKSISPTGTITQEDIKEITDVLQDDFRYKMLDRMEQDRKLLLFQHLGFVHCPMREHCPAGSNCLDGTLPLILNTRVGSLTSTGESQCLAGPPAAPWALTTDSNQINIIVLGLEGIAGEFGKRLLAGCDSERRVSVQGTMWRVEHRVRTDDFSAETTSIDDFAPNGYFCVYQDQESFEYIRGCAEKTLLSSLQEDKLPFQGLPLVVMFVQEESMDKKELARLQEEGQNLADNLHCSYMEATVNELGTESWTSDAVQELVRANREKASYAHLYRDVIVCFDSDIRIMVCMFCDDPYSPERVLSPLLSHRSCFLTGDRSIVIETFLGDSKRKVEVIISSFHGATQFREELIHGFILIYSAKRKASLATLNAFSMNIPNLPIQMVAVTDGGGSAASTFFGTDLGHALITEGNATADRLAAHFTTYSSSAENKSAFYTPFFLEVWERKGEIERAFRMEQPHNHNHNLNLPDVASARPQPPPRNHSYHLNHMREHKLTNSLDLLIGPDSRADIDSEYSDTLNNSKNRGFLKGFSVYPPPSTPPEPAPPDHRLHTDLSPDLNCSEDSLSTHESDGGGLWQPASYGHRAFTTGRTRPHLPPQRPRHSQTLKQPGKLDMNNYTMVSDALQHITIGPPPHSRDRKSQRSGWSHPSSQQGGHHHHPSGVSSETELDAQYAQIKEPNEYMEAPSMMRLRRHRRHEKTPMHQPSFSETDSSGSSEASVGAAVGARLHARRRHNAHHAPRHYKKRSLGNLVAVQSPRVPKLGMFVGPPELPTGYRARTQEEKAASESSEGSSDGETRRPRPLPPPPHHEPPHKMLSGEYPSSAQDNSSSSAPDTRRRPHPFSKHDRRHKEFSKSKDSKKNSVQVTNTSTIQNWGPQGSHGVPLFVEKCVEFIEREGLASEGLYRVPGNRAHVDMLFSKFYEDPNVDLDSLDIPVNAVATALKDFFSKKLPPLLDEASMEQLEDIATMRGCMAGGVELKDRSWRLLALRALLHSALTPLARATLDYLLDHFARVADNSKLNSMDSKNLAICWWPTLLPVQFSDMGRFEMTRPYLEDIVQTMIDQHPFLFRGQEAFVMV